MVSSCRFFRAFADILMVRSAFRRHWSLHSLDDRVCAHVFAKDEISLQYPLGCGAGLPLNVIETFLKRIGRFVAFFALQFIHCGCQRSEIFVIYSRNAGNVVEPIM